MPSPEIRAAVYARVSTEDQATHGTSLGGQVDHAGAYIAAQGWTLAGTWVDDGVSGATLDRPALAGLRATIARREVDRVVVAAPDRLSRDLVDGLVLEREWGELGATVVYLTAPEMSPLERQLRGVIAEEERRAIRDRTREGRRRTVLAGGWIGGDPPFGLRVAGAGRGNRRLVIDEREAAVVQMACRLLIDERLTTGQAARALNDTPEMGPRKSLRWDHRSLRRLLRSATWLSGTWTFDEPGAAPIPVEVPAVLTIDRHADLDRVLATSSTGPRLDVGSYILRAGMLTGECGSPMYGKVRSGKVRNGDADAYVCVQQLRHGAKACGCRTLRCESVDTAVWGAVASLLADPARLAEMAGVALDEHRSLADAAGSDDLAAIDRRISRLTTAVGDRVASLLAAGMDAAVVQRATAKLQADLDQLRRQRSQVAKWATSRRESLDRAAQIRELAGRAAETLAAPTLTVQVRVLAVLGVAVTVTGWVACSTCSGKGSIVAAGTGRRPPLPCPACRRFRGQPILEIAGRIPTASSLGAGIEFPDGFRLISA